MNIQCFIRAVRSHFATMWGAINSSVKLSIILLCILVVAWQKAAAQPQVTGQWVTLPYLMPINPIRVDLLRNGKVLIVAGSENEADNGNNSVSAVWDLAAQTVTVQSMLWDVFCNGGTFFADGRCMVVGGTVQYDPFYGDPRVTVFDPVTNQFNQLQSMANGRWYATAITLGDGRVMAWSGLDETGGTNRTVEIYEVGVGWSPPCDSGFAPPLYPWLHLLPNGLVFYSGSTPSSDFFDPSQADPNVTGSGWTFGPAHYYGLDRTYGTSVLLPLLPPDYKPRVMVMGGGIPTATATTEIIDLSQTNLAWGPGGDMPSGARVQMDAVLLPNGKVLALGGSVQNEDPTTATLGADLYDPATGVWSSAGTSSFPRLYHSVALLLPDGTVASAGSNPERGTYEEHIEIYSPAYLFAADGTLAARPVISKTPAKIGYGAGTFQVKTADAANIASVVLVRPGSVTHAFNMEQRVVGLSFTSSSGALAVNRPPNSNVVPPGYYMLFLLNNGGVPSVASFVQVINNRTDRVPTARITAPAADLTIKAGQTVKFNGSAGDSDGSVSAYSWYFPSGTPNTSTLLNPGAIRFPTAGTSVVSLTVLDNLGINNPSPPTRTIHVQPTVRITNPADGATVTGTVSIRAKAIGAVGDENTFTFVVDGTVVDTVMTSGTNASCKWNTKKQGPGPHTLTVSVTCSEIIDPASKTGSLSKQVNVQ